MDRNEAIEIVKNNWPNGRYQLAEALETLIPELTESEDERIKKGIESVLKHYKDNGEIICPYPFVKIDECLAWLEKQDSIGNINEKLRQYREYLVEETERWHKKEEDETHSKAGKQDCIGHANAYISARAKFEDLFNYDSWLEKQGNHKPLYIRFGDIPANEKSKIYRGDEEIGEEDGVSVYPAFESNGNIVIGLTLPITKTTLYTQQHLLEYDNRPCYLVSGDYVGKGADGEPLIKNVSVIKQLDNYRIKEINKQDEQKPILDFKAKDWYVSKVDGKIHNIYYSVDKVEPKFNVDDWIISDTVAKDYRIVKINEIKDGNYYITSIYGYQGFNSFDVFEKDYHLWTIEDAKKGDILQANKCTLIFDSLTKDIDGNTVISSWYYCDTKTFYGMGTFGPDLWVIEGIVPATKEQRDLLFQKMKEAGYEWNPEKKELKKIGQQSTEWSKQQVVNALTNWLSEEIAPLHKKSLNGTITEREEMFEAALLEMRSFVNGSDFQIGKDVPKDWSEEDEQMLQKALSTIRYALLIPIDKEDDPCFSGSSTISWLKSLKKRMKGLSYDSK